MILVYLSLVVLLVACLWTVAKALEQPPKHTPAHRGERRRRSCGDLLTDHSYDRDDDWPGELIDGAYVLTEADAREMNAVVDLSLPEPDIDWSTVYDEAGELTDDERREAEAVAERVVANLRAIREETPNA